MAVTNLSIVFCYPSLGQTLRPGQDHFETDIPRPVVLRSGTRDSLSIQKSIAIECSSMCVNRTRPDFRVHRIILTKNVVTTESLAACPARECFDSCEPALSAKRRHQYLLRARREGIHHFYPIRDHSTLCKPEKEFGFPCI